MIHNLERLPISAWPDNPARVETPEERPEEKPLYGRVHKRIKSEAEQEAIDEIKRILATGTGVFESYGSDGGKWVLPAGELFEALIENEESDDLALILGAVFGPDNGGKEKLEALIERFAQSHAQCVADATTSMNMERDYE